ncbi:GNAT family N-acetyltransferase [Nakamurella endophytica]|uniref:N-acetyltransferase domain-containing protein n=1 Tax=Nakamurella endophytica TaxID=1748367 RepID=A0A917WCH3_9ACTN|nr:GNAT family N-acetyltransferase [Nakamurella endophytica]GGL92732.1 hypothetical protein GCM10011594_10660 [Nakamurella endophytica]
MADHRIVDGVVGSAPVGDARAPAPPPGGVAPAAGAGDAGWALAVRAARPDDIPALTALYNHYVRTSEATFDLDEWSEAQRAEWFSHYGTAGPHRLLVAEAPDGGLLGYASSSPFRPRAGYRTSVEVSVYVDPGGQGRGVGRALYRELFDLLDGQPLHRAYAGVALPNPASLALHHGFGFRGIGTFTEVGSKFGRYIDVAWLELDLERRRSGRGGPVPDPSG